MRPLGHIATVHYVGTLEDGTVFDTTKGGDPVAFVIGRDEACIGFEDAVMNMKEGEFIDVAVPPEKAYGRHLDELVVRYPAKDFPNAQDLPVGKTIIMPNGNGGFAPAKVLLVDDNIVELDANHPLAGQTLHFHIELVSLKSPNVVVPSDVVAPGVANYRSIL